MNKYTLGLLAFLWFIPAHGMKFAPLGMTRLLKFEGVWTEAKLPVTLEKLKSWSERFPSKKAFGAFSHPDNKDQSTLLYVLMILYDKFEAAEADSMIDFLLTECESDPDAGVDNMSPLFGLHTTINCTPYLLATNNAKFSHLLDQFERARDRACAEKEQVPFLELYKKWKNNAVDTQAVIAYFGHRTCARAAIDACILDDGTSVRDDLELMGTDEAKKILAYAAPHQLDADNGLKNLMIGCVEYGVSKEELSRFYFTQNKKRAGKFTCDIDAILVDGTKTIGLYLQEKLLQKDPAIELLYRDAIQIHFKEHRSGLPAHISRLEKDWLWPNICTEKELSQLLLHCTQDPARMAELRRLLSYKDDSLDLQKISYQGETLDTYLKGLDDTMYPHKKAVTTLLDQHTLGVLMHNAAENSAAFPLFKAFFDAHPWDIDSIKIEIQSLGSKLREKDGCPVKAYVQPYRSNPWEARTLRRCIKQLLGGKDPLGKDYWIKQLKALIAKESLNIDLIILDPTASKETIAEVLEARKATDPQAAEILSIDRINQFRTKTNSGTPDTNPSNHPDNQKNPDKKQPAKSSFTRRTIVGTVITLAVVGIGYILYQKYRTSHDHDYDDDDALLTPSTIKTR